MTGLRIRGLFPVPGMLSSYELVGKVWKQWKP